MLIDDEETKKIAMEAMEELQGLIRAKIREIEAIAKARFGDEPTVEQWMLLLLNLVATLMVGDEQRERHKDPSEYDRIANICNDILPRPKTTNLR